VKPRYLSLAPFIAWQQVERPIDWQRRFGRDVPLEIEIGFGNGEFLVRRAQAHPERNLAGIELEWASVQRTLRKIALAEVDNVRLLQADARMALERLFLPRSVQRAYALFPCPWPKKRHARHRLFARAFLRLLNSRLATGGEVQIVTDHRPYLDWLLEQIPGAGFEAHWQTIPPRFETKYERKWQNEGREQFYELRLLKQTHLAIPLKEDVILKIHRLAHFDPDRFRPAGESGQIAVAFKEFLYDPQRRKGLARVFVVEENLKQEFWIEIVRLEEGWTIRPARGSGVAPTAGVQRALDLARDAARS
jgi:tRNA (guanine-N7-)-methyltransferase